jgi:hypothetical protein
VLIDAGDTWGAGICEEVGGLSAWTGVGVRVREVKTYRNRFLWEGGHDHLQGSKGEAVNPNKGYIMRGQKALGLNVKLNPRH